MEKPQRPKKITKDFVRDAIKKIRRRKGVSEDTITITMIAKEVGCSRQYLYRDEFSGVLAKYKKGDDNDDTSIAATRGSKEYYIEISRKKDKVIEKLEAKVSKALDNLVDEEVLKSGIRDLKKELNALKEQESTEVSQLKETISKKNLEIKWLRDLNGRLNAAK